MKRVTPIDARNVERSSANRRAPPPSGKGTPLEAPPETIKIRLSYPLHFPSQSGLTTLVLLVPWMVAGCGHRHRKERGKIPKNPHGTCGVDVMFFFFFSRVLVNCYDIRCHPIAPTVRAEVASPIVIAGSSPPLSLISSLLSSQCAALCMITY